MQHFKKLSKDEHRLRSRKFNFLTSKYWVQAHLKMTVCMKIVATKVTKLLKLETF